MKDKLLRKINALGWKKIILSILGEIIVIFVCIAFAMEEDENIVGAVVSGGCFTLVALIHFFQGISLISNGLNQVYDYISKSNYTYDQLEKEFLNSEVIEGVNIGENHIITRSASKVMVININDIQEMKIRHCGENYAKGRTGYYYLYFIGNNINPYSKIYFPMKCKAQTVVDYLINKNSKIKLVQD